MRIRHPRFDSPIQSPSTTNEMRKQLLNSSQGSSFKMTDSQHSKSRQSSPRLSSADGHVSSLSGMSESLDDPTNVYLNPDFTDPQLMANTDSVGPSPLALLARTCQNIGNIMDCGVVSNRFISPITNSTRKQSTACSLPVANSKIVNNSNSLSKSIKPKGIIVSEATSSLVAKRNVTSKYFSVADLSKMNSSTFGGSDPVNSISSSVVKASRMSDSVENPSTSYQSTARQSSPISSPSNLFPHTNSAKLDSSIAFNNNFLKADDMHQTSNALAQLARLSSSFSLPETPKLNFTNLKSSTNSADNRNPWNDINNGINSGNMQHDTHSLKRMKRRANSTSNSPLYRKSALHHLQQKNT
ncbi:unnamed protein product [Heterobilharzia americana]|nr:unnamed protein product [Heterobilharzia americana]